VQRQKVKSSAIHSVGHDSEKNILEVQFHAAGCGAKGGKDCDCSCGAVYQSVPGEFQAHHFETFKSHNSIGGHFAGHISRNYKMTKIEG
jgi:KTSC domain